MRAPVQGAPLQGDPLQQLDETFPAAGDAAWLPGRQLFLAEPEASRSILANEDGLYQEHSDFFQAHGTTFGTRAEQVEMGRASRALLRSYVEAHAAELPAAVARLGAESAWPDAGNWLVYHHLAGALIAPEEPASLRRMTDRIVEHAVLAGARERRSWLARALFRFRMSLAFDQAIERRRKRRDEPPRDLLDVVVRSTHPDTPADALTEVFLSFLFAIAGSVGFTLGWSVYLMGTHREPPAGAGRPIEPGWVVREALRLWPVAWMLGRRPAREHVVAGVQVTPGDMVVVCPYLAHRNPKHWEAPDEYRPERWAEGAEGLPAGDRRAWIPFGSGPRTCAAASLSLQLVEDILKIIASEYHLTVKTHQSRPHVGAALAPPRFTVGLVPRRTVTPDERR